VEQDDRQSGDDPTNYQTEWVLEAARRYRQLKDGTARSTASDEVFARLEARDQVNFDRD
jgi:hypothetical protein